MNQEEKFVALPANPDNRFVGLTLHCLPISTYWFAFKVTERIYIISDEPFWPLLKWRAAS